MYSNHDNQGPGSWQRPGDDRKYGENYERTFASGLRCTCKRLVAGKPHPYGCPKSVPPGPPNPPRPARPREFA